MPQIQSRHAVPRLRRLMRQAGLEESAAALKRVQAVRGRTYPSSTKIEDIFYRYDLMRHRMAFELVEAINFARVERGHAPLNHSEQITEFNTCLPNLGEQLNEYGTRRNDPSIEPFADLAKATSLTSELIQLLCRKPTYLIPVEVANNIVGAATQMCQLQHGQFSVETRDPNERGYVPVPYDLRKTVFDSFV